MKRKIVQCIFLCLLNLGLFSQDQTYIMHRQKYDPGASTIHFSPDGKNLLTGFTDGSFKVLDPETFQATLEVADAHIKAITAMGMPPKMDFILTAGGKNIKIWNRSGKHIGDFKGHATTIWNADISSDGKYAVSSAFNKTFLLWDVYNGVVAAHMRGHADVTLAVCISPDNRLIASGSHDLSVKIWDLASRQVICTLHGPTQEVYDVQFSPDSHLLAATSKERNIRIYQVKEEKLIYLFKGHREAVRKVAFSPDGRYLVSASEDRTLILWDMEEGERIYQFLGSEEPLVDVVFHPDGESFYSISVAGDLTRWALDPELFVLRYFESSYREELAGNPIFEPRQKGEAKKIYRARKTEADSIKATITLRYYQKYLEERDR